MYEGCSFSYTEQTFPYESFDKWEKNRYNSKYVMRNKEKEWQKYADLGSECPQGGSLYTGRAA